MVKKMGVCAAGLLFIMGFGVQAAPAIIPAPPQLTAEGYLLIDAATGATLVEFKVWCSSHFLHHLFAEHLGGCFPAQAFSGRVVEPVTDLFHVLIRH